METVRVCRTVHGPVQERFGNLALARRYAMWQREYETLFGYVGLERARSIRDVHRAMARMSWSENFVAADDRGHIGYWHPGLMPLRPRGWDERLPYPGTGEAEWRGFLPRRRLPHVIDPARGWLMNWNNMPSKGWTSGDAPARERLSGEWHRSALLEREVRRARRAGGGWEAAKSVDAAVGAVAEQRPLATRRLRTALRGSSGPARTVLATILAWDGNYNRVNARGLVDPGVAAWEAFKAAAKDLRLGRFGADLRLLQHSRGAIHQFDIFHTEAFALRELGRSGWRRAALLAFDALRKRFGTADPEGWREPRRMFATGAEGAAGPSFPDIPFFDRGTWQQVVEFGPG
jgi:hypothetical protein